MEILSIDAWREIFVTSLTTLWTKLASFAPNLLGAFLILIIGYFVSKLLAKIFQTILVRLRFDTVCERIGIQKTLAASGIEKSGSEIVALLIFWLVMLMFLISVSETMGLDNVAATVETFVLYLPNVIGAVIIFVIGAAIAGFVRELVSNTASRLGMDYASSLSSVTYGVLIMVVGILAVDQLQVDTSFLANAIQILLFAIGLALALTLGFGTRQISQHLVSGIYARELFNHGDHVEFDNIKGVVDEVGTVSSRIKLTGGGTVQIPNTRLISTTVTKQA